MKAVDGPLLRYRMRCNRSAQEEGDQVDNLRRSGIIPPMILTLDAKRRLTLPASLVSAQPGDNFEAVFDPEEVKMDDLPPRRREFPKRLKL